MTMVESRKEVSSKMTSEQQFCLRWNDHQSTLVAIFETLLESNILVDCTLAAEGQCLKAHKVVLSACSPYFQLLLSQHFDKHPIIILKDVKFEELKAMIDYMYRGEVKIPQDQLAPLLKAAESLQIRGLGCASNQNGKSNKPLPFDKSWDKECITSRGGSGSPPPRPHSSGPVMDVPLSFQSSDGRRGSVSPTPRKRMRRPCPDDCSDVQCIDPPPENHSPAVPEIVSHPSLAPLSGSSRSLTSTRLAEWPEINTEKKSSLTTLSMDSVPPLAPLSSFSDSVKNPKNKEWSEMEIRRNSPTESNNLPERTTNDSQKFSPISEILLVPKTEYVDVEDESLTNAMLDDVQDMEASGPSHTDGSAVNAAFVPWLENLGGVPDETGGVADTAAAYRASQVYESMLIIPSETSNRSHMGKLKGIVNSEKPPCQKREGRKLSGLRRKKKETMTEEEREQLRKYERERKQVQRAKKAARAQASQSAAAAFTSSSLWGPLYNWS